MHRPITNWKEEYCRGLVYYTFTMEGKDYEKVLKRDHPCFSPLKEKVVEDFFNRIAPYVEPEVHGYNVVKEGKWMPARIRYNGCIPCDGEIWVLDGDLEGAIKEFEADGEATFYFWLDEELVDIVE